MLLLGLGAAGLLIGLQWELSAEKLKAVFYGKPSQSQQTGARLGESLLLGHRSYL